MMMMASSSSSTSQWWKYHVFLSFRGEDTRKTFVDHLYTALTQCGIHTYKDDVTLDRGDTIGLALMSAIRESHIALIIFSQNYANSSWCLDELSYIMKCKEEIGQIIIPIFYNVEPSDVRRQIEQWVVIDKSWIKALVEASNIAGWVTKRVADGHEARCIQEIVGDILNKFPYSGSLDELKFVGMGTRLQRLRSHLKIGLGGVRMVGIWGVGGGGKTTLAFSAYMKLRVHFSGHCFIGNIREKSQQINGLEKLQETILLEVLKTRESVTSVQEGRCKIQSKLCHRKVLIVLDDVDHLDQLKALAGSREWFGDGSRILITTRDQHLLTTHRVDQVSPIGLLSDGEAVVLFNMHASNENNLVPDYEVLSKEIVTYAAGLPLALIVLGSFLYDKDKNEWLSTLARLNNQPEMGIVEKLKISYDGLKPMEKELFLDIACLFRGKNKDEAIEILDACGFYPDIGVKVLKQKALITVSSADEFDMHKLVQEMAHCIVRGEHLDNPEKYSRVWRKEDIEDICYRNATTENHKIEAIQCNAEISSFNFIMLFSNMKKLRFLNVTTTSFNEGPSFLSNELRYLSWSNYPPTLFPESFQPTKLVVLKMKRSLQIEIWNGYKYLPCLKEMELSYMKALVRTPDIPGLQFLQQLTLKGCESLKEIHESLGNHASLVYLYVTSCERLTSFPSIVKMNKLKILRISNCKALIEFPKIEANMDNLVELSLNNVGIEILPSTIGEYCTNLNSINLKWCSKLKSIEGKLPRSSLTKLDLSCCKLTDGEIPSEIGELSNLKELDLECNNFRRLDFSLVRLARLKLLNLRRCGYLDELPELPSGLAILNADGCESLEIIKIDAHRRFKWLCDVSIQGCRKIITGGQILLDTMLQGKALKSGCMILQLKGLEIPRGFEPRVVKGRICRMQVSENWYNDHSGFLFCVVLNNCFYLPRITTTRVEHDRLPGESMRMPDSRDDVYWEETVNDKCTCMIYVSFGLLRNTSWWDQTSNAIQVEIDSLDDGYTVSGCGSKLIPISSETTLTSSSDDISDDYTCQLKIRQDIFHVSKSAFKFYIECSFRPNLNVYLTKIQI